MKLKNQIIFILIIFLVIFTLILIINGDIRRSFSYTSETLQLLFSIITLIIAINVYDKFGVNKQLTEKRTELLVDLLRKLKKINFRVIMKTKESTFSRFFISSKNITKDIDSLTKKQLEAKILFRTEDRDKIVAELVEFIDNPILPLVIKEKMGFLKPKSGLIISNPMTELNNISLMYFHINNQNINGQVEWILESNGYNLREFVIKIRNLYLEIDKWIKDHSNLNDKLNI